MNILLDTQLLLWLAYLPERLSSDAECVLLDESHNLFFSVASLWEVGIKQVLRRRNFNVDARMLRRELLDHGYHECPILSMHVLSIVGLPLIHKDPFDRLLVSQAAVEGMTLLTSDKQLAKYPGSIWLV